MPMRHACLAVSAFCSLAFCSLAICAAGPAAAEGVLRCNVQGGFGVVIAANRGVTCTYRRPDRPVEFYTGSTGNIGIDIGPTNANVVTYHVTADPDLPGVLQGDFAGPGLGIATGAGFSAHALIGSNGVMLTPVPNAATTAFTGININAGIGQLHLMLAGYEGGDGGRVRIRRVLRSYGLPDETR